MMQHFLAMLAFLAAAPLAAEPAALSVPGEIRVEIRKIDQPVMRRYGQNRITHITFHHEGFAGNDAALFAKASAARDRQTIGQRVLNINNGHVQSGLGMIAYHYAVDKAGQIAKGRPVRYKPATRSTVIGGSRRADFDGHFAVVALGDFNHERLTDASRLALVRVMSEAQRAFRVPTGRILPHQHHASTSCPGKFLMEEAQSLPRQVLIHSIEAELAARGCGRISVDGVADRATGRAFDRFLRRTRGAFSSRQMGDAALFEMLDKPGLNCF